MNQSQLNSDARHTDADPHTGVRIGPAVLTQRTGWSKSPTEPLPKTARKQFDGYLGLWLSLLRPWNCSLMRRRHHFTIHENLRGAAHVEGEDRR